MMPSWLDRLNVTPTDWLLEKACPSIRARLLAEVLERDHDDVELRAAREEAANYPPPVKISREQKENGTWLDKVLEFEAPNPSRKRGPGLVNQYLALVEYGWDRTHPIVYCSGELLLRFLSEDPTTDLYELNGYVGANELIQKAVRRDLGNMAAALLARSGYAEEPVVCAMAERILDELDAQYPVDGEPDLYDGEIEIPEDKTYRRVRVGAHIPDMFLFYMLAFQPRFLADARGRAAVRRVVAHLMKGDEIPYRIREVESKRYVKLSDLSIGNNGLEQYVEGGVGYLLHDLELLARVGVLPEIPKAMKLLEWLISTQDEEGIFRLDTEIVKHVTRSQYHYFPLEDSWRGKHKKYTDVAFRMMLILKTLDRTAPLA